MRCKGEIINITHNNIKDNRKEKEFSNEMQLRIGYLGPAEKYKGFNLLVNTLKILNKEGIKNFKLDVYGNKHKLNTELNNVFFHGKYNYSDLKDIFNDIDVLIVPSIWRETYGFIVLEAMSYGVPVIVTDYVGAKDLIEDNISGFIVKSDGISLVQKIKQIINNRMILEKVNRNIMKLNLPLDFSEHEEKIKKMYKR